MEHSKYKVLVVATSRNTRGGITSVVQAYSQCHFWEKYQIRWIETHVDKSFLLKLWYALKSIVVFIFVAPYYDMIHIHLSELPSAIRKTPFFFIGKLYRKKIILHFHASPETVINEKNKPLYAYLFTHANKVIILSEFWRKWFEETFQLDKNIAVVYNPCPDITNREQQTKAPVILYAGNISTKKGYQDLLTGFSAIASKYPSWKITFAGKGEIEKGVEMAKALHIDSQVDFVGWIEGKEKERLFSTASIFCLPSYTEGFPVVILEACAYGLPFITTPVGGIPDLIHHQENGLLFTPGNTKELASLLEKLITDEKLREKLSHESQNLAKSTFNIKRIGKQIDTLYTSLIEQ